MDFKIKLVQDSHSENPRDWENVGIIATKNFNGDESIKDPIDWLREKMGWSEDYLMRIVNNLDASYYSDTTKEYLEEQFLEKYIGFPLYKYEHSGIALSTTPFSCPWDSGQIGYLYTTKKRIRKVYAVKRVSKDIIEKARKSMLSELETFGQWVSGDVYGFQVESENEELEDSCSGFYGTNWAENGILDYLDYEALGMTHDEAVEHLEGLEIGH